MDKGKIVAVITGAISILIAIAYLVLVQIIDFRGEMIPAPISQLSSPSTAQISSLSSSSSAYLHYRLREVAI
ncbi:MAG: hypothetical protein AAFQ14_16780 [Cyanobacteria bacterium J06621_12]